MILQGILVTTYALPTTTYDFLQKISVTTNDFTRNFSYNLVTCYEFTNILVTTNDFTRNFTNNLCFTYNNL